MQNADCCNARVVNRPAASLRRQGQRFKMLQVLVGLADKRKVGKRAQRAQLSEGRLGRRCSLVAARMRYDGEELMCARPGDGPFPGSGGQGFVADRARS